MWKYSNGKRFLFSIFVVVAGFAVFPVSAHADTTIDAARQWVQVSHTQKRQQKRDIPARLRGTYYTFNFLQNRQERISISARKFTYSYQKHNGKYYVWQKFSGKHLAYISHGKNSFTVRGARVVTKRGITYMTEKTDLKRAGNVMTARFHPFVKGELSGHKIVKFRRHVKMSHPKAQKLTLQWLKNKNYIQGYTNLWTQQTFTISNNGRVKFDWTAGLDSSVGDDFDSLSESTVSKIANFIPDSEDSSKGILIIKTDPNDYYMTLYRSLYVHRISKNYIECSNAHLKSYHGHKLTNIKTLNSRLLVRH